MKKIGQLVQYSGKWKRKLGLPHQKKDQYKLEKIKKGEVGSMLNVTSVKNSSKYSRNKT